MITLLSFILHKHDLALCIVSSKLIALNSRDNIECRLNMNYYIDVNQQYVKIKTSNITIISSYLINNIWLIVVKLIFMPLV